ncbi:HlyD family secretion protein [bacterium A37T11]|nr:HlyD family secretion protein [bacterium A37T11]
MKRKNIIILVVVILALALVYFFFFRKKEVITTLNTVVPEVGDVSQIVTSTGTVQPVDTVQVGTQISGIIKKIYTDFNAQVTQGQLLAELDPTLMQAQVDQLKASLQQALSNQDYQTINFERQKKLYNVGAISKANYDIAVNSNDVAKASVSSIRAQLRAAEQNLSFTKIYSPISGVVLNRNVSEGQTVAASFNTPTLFSLAKDITKMQVRAKVDEADIGGIKTGQRVTFTVDAYLDRVFEGSVAEIRLQPSTSANVVTYTTIINASNDDMKLKPGMTATITIFTNEAKKVLVLPVNALKFFPDSAALGHFYHIVPTERHGEGKKLADNGQGADSTAVVWVVKGSQVLQKHITTGINDNTKVEIRSGLTPADSVITGVNAAAAEVAQGAQGASPFMPKRPNSRR